MLIETNLPSNLNSSITKRKFKNANITTRYQVENVFPNNCFTAIQQKSLANTISNLLSAYENRSLI